MAKAWNHDYKVHLSIGLTGCDRSATINPSKDSSYSEEEWNNLSEGERERWLYAEAEDWANNFIDLSVQP